ncbi:hypothetical protein CDAR_192491 [Caerostris darwini]|uniref:Uncharacterized protein n=1 Tax=Caerostris darwini TaxID=1538125 RepID=A0AAV4W6H1_9ARAC|nr:hypothetical protein CDAR_192491 [Caerostris darwini]
MSRQIARTKSGITKLASNFIYHYFFLSKIREPRGTIHLSYHPRLTSSSFPYFHRRCIRQFSRPEITRNDPCRNSAERQKQNSTPLTGSELSDLRSLRRCVPTTSYSMKLITRH